MSFFNTELQTNNINYDSTNGLKIKNSIENIDLEWLLSDKIEDNYEKQEETSHSTVIQNDKKDLKSKNIDRIVIFFKDGSFNNYNN